MYQAGDIILVRSRPRSVLARLITAGERARHGDTDVARWTHCALITRSDGTTVQATRAGVQRFSVRAHLAQGDEVHIISPRASAWQRNLACCFAEAHINERYDVLDIVALSVQVLTGLNVSLHMDRRFICSSLVARATEKYVTAYPHPPEDMTPADIAAYWKVASGLPLPDRGRLGRALDGLVRFIRFLTRAR